MIRHRSVESFKRHGSISVLAAVFLAVTIAFLAFSIDYGYIVVSESDLQNAADAGAVSGARALNQGRDAAILASKNWAGMNIAAGNSVVVGNSDVEIGRWESVTATFTVVPTGSLDSPNAVRVTCRRTSAGGNPLNLFIAPAIGKSSVDLEVTAIALRPSGGVGSRFLIDNEMIDTGILSIENLANSLGRGVAELLTARGFNQGKQYGDGDWTWEDNFLDLPAGATLSLPTGQGTSYNNNDAGMFDIDHPEFPFSDNLSLQNFLKYSETGNDPSKWGTDNNSVKSQLDPLRGVAPVTNSGSYSSFVSPDFIHVSPVFSSDISTLGMQGTIPQVNALGLRRGLIAFKFTAVGADVDGSGSVLPMLVIEIVDPATINPNDINLPGEGGGGGKTRLVQ